jgi:2-polyprenyl-3-methyl-5-hydroxy-6-metoxy-1,4-benzoquinol methylase
VSAPSEVGRRALRLYADAGAATRAHVRIRWYTCPFPPIAGALPEDGRILEVGCGHGLFSAFLALQAPRRSVRGIDIDAAKIDEARAAAAKAQAMGADLDFAVARSGELLPGPWDGIVIVDVLYLLDEDAQVSLLRACAEALAPGGVLAIKEMADQPRWKFRWNRLQETLSVRVLRITQGASFTFLPPARLAAVLSEAGLRTSSVRLDQGRMHPHHLLVGRRPPKAAESAGGADVTRGARIG